MTDKEKEVQILSRYSTGDEVSRAKVSELVQAYEELIDFISPHKRIIALEDTKQKIIKIKTKIAQLKEQLNLKDG